jgi:hypothetical protein
MTSNAEISGLTDDLAYQGIDRNGAERHGVASARPPVALVEEKFAAGWRSLTVKRNSLPVGEIHRSDQGKRTWWAES